MTLELPADSPALSLPWIITIGPLSDDEEWEPVVCGPYERPHALALAGSVVADEELMAVVGPVQPYVSVDQIRADIVSARLTASMCGDLSTSVITKRAFRCEALFPPPDPSSSNRCGAVRQDSISTRSKKAASSRYSAGAEKIGHHSASSPYSFTAPSRSTSTI